MNVEVFIDSKTKHAVNSEPLPPGNMNRPPVRGKDHFGRPNFDRENVFDRLGTAFMRDDRRVWCPWDNVARHGATPRPDGESAVTSKLKRRIGQLIRIDRCSANE